MQIDEIIVGHTGDIVHDDLIRLGLFIGNLPGIPGLVNIINMMTEDGAIHLLLLQILQQLLVDLLHHRLHHPLQDGPARLVGVNDGVIFLLIGLDRLEMLLVQHDIRLAVAVFDDIHHQIVDDLGVDGADDRGGGEISMIHHLNIGGILPVLAQIGDDVGNADHIAFQRGGLDLVGVAGNGVALLQLCLKIGEAVHGHRTVLRQLDLTVVTGDAGKGLQGQVQGEDLIQHPGGMDIVGKIPAGMLVVQIVEEHLAAVGKGGVSNVVSQGDGLDQVQVQVQGAADGPGDAGHQLNMEAAAGNVIIFDQGKDLGLVCIAIVVRAVHDPVDVLGEIGPPDRSGLIPAKAADRHAVREGTVKKSAIGFFILHPGGKSIRKLFFCHGIGLLFSFIITYNGKIAIKNLLPEAEASGSCRRKINPPACSNHSA